MRSSGFVIWVAFGLRCRLGVVRTHSRSVMGRFPPVDMDLQLIILAGGLVIVDRSCDAFDPVHAITTAWAVAPARRRCGRRYLERCRHAGGHASRRAAGVLDLRARIHPGMPRVSAARRWIAPYGIGVACLTACRQFARSSSTCPVRSSWPRRWPTAGRDGVAARCRRAGTQTARRMAGRCDAAGDQRLLTPLHAARRGRHPWVRSNPRRGRGIPASSRAGCRTACTRCGPS